MWFRTLALTGLATVVLAGAVVAQTTGRDDAAKITRDFKIERPAHLSKPEALTIYENIGNDLAKGYAMSWR